MTGNARKRSLGLAAILVVGTIAGFLVAAGTSGAEYATVGTISDSQAFQMPVEQEDQRVRFALAADQATAEQPSATFALYDPADEFFTEIELSGDGDDAEAILDRPGSWVLFVTERRNAELSVQYEAGDESADAELEEIPVAEERTTVAEQGGGSLDEQVALRLDQRPASVFLEYTGNIEGLDATVSSDEGVAYELSAAQANTTENGTQRSGDTSITSANLVEGTYEVTATADAFDGELTFVQQTYERPEAPSPEQPDDDVERNVSTHAEAGEGTVVAELAEGEAYEIDTASASEISFLASPETHAQLMVYNDSDRLVDRVELEDDRGYDWDEDEGEERRQRNATSKSLALPSAGTYVVYAAEIDHGNETVHAVVEAEGGAAEQLEVQTQEAELEGSQASWNTTLEGALVEIDAHVRDVAGTERNVTATGEAGPVLHQEQEFNTFGAAVYHEREVHPENFTDGDLEVVVEGDGVGSRTEIQVVNYVR